MAEGADDEPEGSGENWWHRHSALSKWRMLVQEDLTGLSAQDSENVILDKWIARLNRQGGVASPTGTF